MKIKKILLTLLLFGVSLISFGYCDQTFYLNLPATLQDGIGTNDFELLDNANFLMNDTYKVFQIKGTALYPRLSTIFWSNTGLYFIDSCEGGYDCQNIHTSIKMQGFIQRYCVKDYNLTGFNLSCSRDCNECIGIENFINDNKYKNPDTFDIVGVWSQNGIFCFGYENLSQKICFTTDDFDFNYYSQLTGSLGFTYNPFVNELTGGSLLMNYINDSPFGEGGTNETGGTTKFCPPIKVYTDSYGSSYNENLCYSNGEEISGGAIIKITPINMFEAFPTYQDFINKYNILHNNCHLRDGNTEEECMEALRLIGKKQAEILLKVSSEEGLRGQSLGRIYQYCRYKVNYTGDNERDKGICELTEEEKYAPGINSGINNGPNAQEQLITRIDEQDNEIFEIAIPEEGGIFDQLLPDGIITRTDLEFYTTATAKLTRLYISVLKLWKARPYVEGILPPAIMSLLLLFILFRIFKRKNDKDN